MRRDIIKIQIVIELKQQNRTEFVRLPFNSKDKTKNFNQIFRNQAYSTVSFFDNYYFYFIKTINVRGHDLI